MTVETLQKANDLNNTINQLMYATEHMTFKDDKNRTIDLISRLEDKLKQL